MQKLIPTDLICNNFPFPDMHLIKKRQIPIIFPGFTEFPKTKVTEFTAFLGSFTLETP